MRAQLLAVKGRPSAESLSARWLCNISQKLKESCQLWGRESQDHFMEYAEHGHVSPRRERCEAVAREPLQLSQSQFSEQASLHAAHAVKYRRCCVIGPWR